jgi:rare lipoprotein A
VKRLAQTILLAAALLALANCGHKRVAANPPPPPPSPSPFPTQPPTVEPGPVPVRVPPPGASLRVIELGMASWYGVPFHGRKASNGETYDMYKMTAAHRTLPFDTVVRVTNLVNGKYADVRITDRGPFVEGRVIDLSLAAARAIDMVATGVSRVKLEWITGPITNGAFTVQVGAFAQYANALNLRKQLERTYQPVFIFEYDSPRGMLYRVRVGRAPSEQAAQALARKLSEKENVSTFVVRLDNDQP